MFLSLMLLMAMQQVQSPCDVQTCTFTSLDAPQFTEIVIENHEGYCDKPITFGKTKKKIADVFPEECGVPTTGRLFIPEPAPRVDTSTAFPTPDMGELHTLPYVTEANFPHGGRWGVGADIHPPEPVDVPAIEVIDGQSPMGRCESKAKPGELYFSTTYCPQPHPTCGDKTRILMHDEQNPPKFWCHKPQQ